MRKLAVAACLVLGISLLGAAVPVAKIWGIEPGKFWIWIQNTAPCAHGTIKLDFSTTDVAVTGTLLINGKDAKVKSTAVKDGVVTVTLDPKLPPQGWLIVAVKVPTTVTAEKLLKYKEAFTVPPFCK